MIKILFVIEEEDGIDFRAYSLQISKGSTEMPPTAKLQLIEDNEESHAENTVNRPPLTGFQANRGYDIPQSGRTSETKQIFMN